ncbi:MAG TPA: hypothetical protein VFD61_04285 [Gaiellales bacterium]|nr:hypothetical protein [Gaiellales bacterium]
MTTSPEPAGTPGMMVWPLVAIGAVLGGLVGGFVTHNLPIAGTCALLGAGAVGILAWQAIGRLAQEQQYADWVARRGWQPARNLPAALVTSLLRAGDTRRLEDGFEGEIEGRRAGIGHFIWETVERSVDEYGNVHETRIPHTDTVLETLTGLQSMTRLTLLPRHHGQGRLADGLASALTTDRSVELESAEFCNAYRLFVADEESELVVRRVFTPALIVQLVELAGTRMTIEFETGALVCSVHGRAGATELLDAMEGASVAVADALCKDAASPAPTYVPTHAAQP